MSPRLRATALFAVPALLLAASLVAGTTGCRSSSHGPCCPPSTTAHVAPPPPAPTPVPTLVPTAAAPSAFEAQTARGAAAYGRFCSACHGEAGQGSAGAPALVGAGALPLTRPGAKVRTGEFRTAGDVARFVVSSMPPKGDKPAADDAWAILAFALKANGVSRTDAVGPSNADAIVLHP